MGCGSCLFGENFDDGALVFIGSRPCLNTVVVNERSVSCVTPGSTSEVTESVEVYVQNPNQLVSGTKTFTYQEPEPDAPVPAITGVSPESGEPVWWLSGDYYGFRVLNQSVLVSTQMQRCTLLVFWLTRFRKVRQRSSFMRQLSSQTLLYRLSFKTATVSGLAGTLSILTYRRRSRCP